MTALRSTDAVGQPLSERHVEVLTLIAAGKTVGGAARALHLSEPTVKNHLARLRARLGAETNAHAVALAFRAGVLR